MLLLTNTSPANHDSRVMDPGKPDALDTSSSVFVSIRQMDKPPLLESDGQIKSINASKSDLTQTHTEKARETLNRALNLQLWWLRFRLVALLLVLCGYAAGSVYWHRQLWQREAGAISELKRESKQTWCNITSYSYNSDSYYLVAQVSYLVDNNRLVNTTFTSWCNWAYMDYSESSVQEAEQDANAPQLGTWVTCWFLLNDPTFVFFTAPPKVEANDARTALLQQLGVCFLDFFVFLCVFGGVLYTCVQRIRCQRQLRFQVKTCHITHTVFFLDPA